MNTTQHSSLFWSLGIATDTCRHLNKESELPPLGPRYILPRARCNRFKHFFLVCAISSLRLQPVNLPKWVPVSLFYCLIVLTRSYLLVLPVLICFYKCIFLTVLWLLCIPLSNSVFKSVLLTDECALVCVCVCVFPNILNTLSFIQRIMSVLLGVIPSNHWLLGMTLFFALYSEG